MLLLKDHALKIRNPQAGNLDDVHVDRQRRVEKGG